MTYRRTITFFSMIILLASMGMVFAAENEQTIFLVFGHVYSNYEALEQHITTINDEQADFIIFVGDTLTHPEDNGERIVNIIQQLNAPSYFVPGNHDLYADGRQEGTFYEHLSPYRHYAFTVNGNDFIILDSVGTNNQYGITEEQKEFVQTLYERSNNEKFVFLHHCLFYNYDNQFCNARPFIEENLWNTELVPLLAGETKAVFVGDTGLKEPYFSYEENNIQYFGIGFSAEGTTLKIPPHYLKVVVEENGDYTVEPVPLQKNLLEVTYFQRTDLSTTELAKSYIKKNLANVLTSLTLAIIFLLLIIVALWLRLKDLTMLRRQFRKRI